MKRVVMVVAAVLLFSHAQGGVFCCFCGDSIVCGDDSTRLVEPPHVDRMMQTVDLHHSEASMGNKLLRGCGYSLLYNLSMASVLLVLPDRVTMWGRDDKFKGPVILQQYKNTFTKAPVWDGDLWYINYVGHPYQGSYYYNCLRSQGAGVVASSLFCTAQSMLWEYVWEGGMEQPSVQDLIVTPVLGVLMGEMTHRLTLRMSRNGFRWYEVAFVCAFNPSYAINNGFKRKKSFIRN